MPEDVPCMEEKKFVSAQNRRVFLDSLLTELPRTNPIAEVDSTVRRGRWLTSRGQRASREAV